MRTMNWFDFKWTTDAFIDTWALVHLSWGIILGMVSLLTRLRVITALGASVALMAIWEMFEIIIGISRGLFDVVSDLIVGIIGFVVGYYFLSKFKSATAPILVAVIVFAVVLAYMGWRNSL